jgi:hypothetical protein
VGVSRGTAQRSGNHNSARESSPTRAIVVVTTSSSPRLTRLIVWGPFDTDEVVFDGGQAWLSAVADLDLSEKVLDLSPGTQ